MADSLDSALEYLKWLRSQRRTVDSAIRELTEPWPPWPIAEATGHTIAALRRYIQEIDQQQQAATTQIIQLRRTRPGWADEGSTWGVVRQFYQANPDPPFRAADVWAWIQTGGVPLHTSASDPLQAIRMALSHMAKRGELIRSDAGFQPPRPTANGGGGLVSASGCAARASNPVSSD